MDRRSLLLLAAVLALLTGVAAFAVRRGARPTEERLLWPGADAAKTTRIVITSPSGRFELARKDGRWELASPVAFPADAGAVQPLLEKLPKVVLNGPLTESKARQNLFGLQPEAAIRVQADGGAPLDLQAGKAAPESESTYVRLGGSDAVYEARGLSRSDVERSTADWLSKAVVAVPPAALEHVVMKSTAATVALAKSAAGWSLEGRSVSVSTAPGTPFNVIQGSLADLQADSVLLPPLPALGKPVLEVRVRWTEKGAEQEVLLSAYPEKDGLVPLVKKGEERVRFLVYPWRLDAFKKPASEFH